MLLLYGYARMERFTYSVLPILYGTLHTTIHPSVRLSTWNARALTRDNIPTFGIIAKKRQSLAQLSSW